MPFGWKLQANGEIRKISVNEWFLIGIHKTVMPIWISQTPCAGDFDDWSSRIPRASDNYDHIRGIRFSHGLFYRQHPRAGDGQDFSDDWINERPGGPKDRECDGLRHRNERATSDFPKYPEGGPFLGSDARRVVSEFLEAEKKRRENKGPRHEKTVSD